MTRSRAADEARHAPGDGHWWNESWYFDFASDDGTIGGYVRLGLYPNQRRAWCWVQIVDGDGTVSVRSHEVPMPPQSGLVVRDEALWCELLCESPFEHWSIGVEAFGVRLDDPRDAYRGEIGSRLAVGLDLEWEVGAPVYDYVYPPEYPSMHYQHVGAVHGEILLGDEVIAFEGHGERDHSYGDRDWWLFGWNWASARFNDGSSAHLLKGDYDLFTNGYLRAPGEDNVAVTELDVDAQFDDDGLPISARYTVNGERIIDVTAVHHAAIPLVADDGRTARFPRSLCEFRDDAGRVGYGWAEWLQVGRPTVG